ncbi:MAG TPA: hypothetical protein DEB31_03990 [Clostridiales bacterium]|nr:hypothetical protein [Clostridiales bacterium]
MQVIMESGFDVVYLVLVITLGFLTIRLARGKKQFLYFGGAAILLGAGDAFHLIPRMWALITAGVTNLPQQAAALGVGKLVTSITMTVFYLILYHVLKERYQFNNKRVSRVIYLLAAARIALCLFPQNEWLSPDAPLSFGIYRNIPFVILGVLIIALFYAQAKLHKDRPFRFMWLVITLSFAFYIPVVLFADSMPMIGMLMIPKTIAYIWIVVMGFRAARKQAAPVA